MTAKALDGIKVLDSKTSDVRSDILENIYHTVSAA